MIIAFIFTEYQQKILTSILIQNKIERVDILFLRENIQLDKNLSKFCKKILPLSEIPYSWRNIPKFYNDYKINIEHHLDKNLDYKIFSWSLEFPQVRLVLRNIKNYELNLLEDGAGSYIYRNFLDFKLKDSIVNKLITISLDLLSIKDILNLKTRKIIGWSLYDNCYPSYNLENQLINHEVFTKVTKDSLKEINKPFLKDTHVVFIQQSYVEMTLMNEDEYIDLHTFAIEKIKNKFKSNKIYWKLHPRTNKQQEASRVNKIKKQINIDIEIININISMEELTMIHYKKDIKYVSFGSSVLYVIPALTNKKDSVYTLYSNFLIKRLKGQSEVNKLYKRIGVKEL